MAVVIAAVVIVVVIVVVVVVVVVVAVVAAVAVVAVVAVVVEEVVVVVEEEVVVVVVVVVVVLVVVVEVVVVIVVVIVEAVVVIVKAVVVIVVVVVAAVAVVAVVAVVIVEVVVVVVVVHFDYEMCFAPQWRALFQLFIFQKCSGVGVFCTFFIIFPSKCASRQPAACNFSSLISPDGSAPAALASLLFSPLEPQNIGNNTVFGDFSTFRAPASSFFGSFSSLIFFLLTHLCFSIYPYCRKFDF